VGEVIAAIEEHASKEPGGALAFDGDGTLWSGDIGEDFFSALLADGRISATAHEALAREATAAGLDSNGTAVEVAHRIHAAYLADAFPEERVCEVMTWAFAGWRRSEMDAFAEQVLASAKLASRLHGEATRIVAWARERGLGVCLVSASPRAIVHAAARLVGIDHTHVASATEQRTIEDVVLPAVDRPIPYGPGKVARLAPILRGRPLYAAFGDNVFDIPMLRSSRVPVAIRPKQRLSERAAEVPGLVVLQAI
jgi:HAD superfamily phosphoserine phosphatase-like hydrolase